LLGLDGGVGDEKIVVRGFGGVGDFEVELELGLELEEDTELKLEVTIEFELFNPSLAYSTERFSSPKGVGIG